MDSALNASKLFSPIGNFYLFTHVKFRRPNNTIIIIIVENNDAKNFINAKKNNIVWKTGKVKLLFRRILR